MRASTSRASALALALVLASLSSASPPSAQLRRRDDASTGDVDAHDPRLAALSRAFDTSASVRGRLSLEPSLRRVHALPRTSSGRPYLGPSRPRSVPASARTTFPGIGALASKTALAHPASSPRSRARPPPPNTPPRTRSPARFATRATFPTRVARQAIHPRRRENAPPRRRRPLRRPPTRASRRVERRRPDGTRRSRRARPRRHRPKTRSQPPPRRRPRVRSRRVRPPPRTRHTRRRATDSPASPGSWSALAFDETLLRFVSDEAEHDAVGAVYPAAWDLPSLASRGAGNADARFAPTACARSRASSWTRGTGVDAAAALRRDALDVIAASLDAAAPIVASAVVDAGRDAYPDGAGHFFEMLRFDFVIRADPENELVPTLVEVNASPNVKPASARRASSSIACARRWPRRSRTTTPSRKDSNPSRSNETARYNAPPPTFAGARCSTTARREGRLRVVRLGRMERVSRVVRAKSNANRHVPRDVSRSALRRRGSRNGTVRRWRLRCRVASSPHADALVRRPNPAAVYILDVRADPRAPRARRRIRHRRTRRVDRRRRR